MAMRAPVLAIAFLVGSASVALADDAVPPPQAAPAAEPARPQLPILINQPQVPARIISATSVGPTARLPENLVMDARRFSFVRVDDGFLRFDLRTGQVASCNPHPEGWGCQAVPENRSALEREVTGLKDEVAALKHQVEQLNEPAPRPPAAVPPPPATPGAQGDVTRDAPQRGDFARAGAMLHNVWDRLVDTIVGFKNDVMRKS